MSASARKQHADDFLRWYQPSQSWSHKQPHTYPHNSFFTLLPSSLFVVAVGPLVYLTLRHPRRRRLLRLRLRLRLRPASSTFRCRRRCRSRRLRRRHLRRLRLRLRHRLRLCHCLRPRHRRSLAFVVVDARALRRYHRQQLSLFGCVVLLAPWLQSRDKRRCHLCLRAQLTQAGRGVMTTIEPNRTEAK